MDSVHCYISQKLISRVLGQKKFCQPTRGGRTEAFLDTLSKIYHKSGGVNLTPPSEKYLFWYLLSVCIVYKGTQ